MQVDMHYYGVYCMARAAGMKRDAAKTIAYASQYVDDSNISETITTDKGSKAISEATAHHTTDIKNIDHDDQRYIWVPFHFYPGGEGVDFTERLICRKDSKLVNEMVQNHMEQDKPYLLELMGIAMHVYADTFAHYGFSGVSSRKNRVDGSSINLYNISPTISALLGTKVAKWFKKYGDQGGLLRNIRTLISDSAEFASGALGHGGVSIYPDQPYLSWDFEYEYITPSRDDYSKRNNPDTFLEACNKMYEMFSIFLEMYPQHKDRNVRVKINKLEPILKSIIATEGDKDARIVAWTRLAEDGVLYNATEKMPIYDADSWHNQYNKFSNLTSSKDFATLSIYKFFQAASYHKHYALREQLPKNGIIVI